MLLRMPCVNLAAQAKHKQSTQGAQITVHSSQRPGAHKLPQACTGALAVHCAPGPAAWGMADHNCICSNSAPACVNRARVHSEPAAGVHEAWLLAGCWLLAVWWCWWCSIIVIIGIVLIILVAWGAAPGSATHTVRGAPRPGAQ